MDRSTEEHGSTFETFIITVRVLGGLAVPPAQAVIRDRMSCPAGSSQLDACLTLNWKRLILWWVNTDCSSLQLMEPSPLRANVHPQPRLSKGSVKRV